jgi:hypothetical protein
MDTSVNFFPMYRHVSRRFDQQPHLTLVAKVNHRDRDVMADPNTLVFLPLQNQASVIVSVNILGH